MKHMNPLAVVVVSLVWGVVVLISFDVTTAALMLACEMAVLPWLGVPVRAWLRIGAVMVVSAGLAGVTTALYGRPSGQTLWLWGPVHVSQGSLTLALAVFLRILAIGLPGAVAFAATTPTRLADALGQVWRLPSRFVMGSLAALRSASLMPRDITMASLARRARGLPDGWGPRAVWGRFSSVSFGLFVRSIRRASTVATAMEARGFDSGVARTWARESTWRARDWALVVGGFGIAVGVVGLSVALGDWRMVFA